jgi:small-conductance mechanosensitive channel
MEVINKVGLEMAQDPNWKTLSQSPRAIRVDKFADSGIEIESREKPNRVNSGAFPES